jgi:hypothetical protein
VAPLRFVERIRAPPQPRTTTWPRAGSHVLEFGASSSP